MPRAVTVSESVGALPGVAQLIKLPQPKGQEASYPAALDGSPFGFYYSGSNTSTKWTINIQGHSLSLSLSLCLSLSLSLTLGARV